MFQGQKQPFEHLQREALLARSLPAPHMMCMCAHAMYARALHTHTYTHWVVLTGCVSLCSVQRCVRVCERVSRATV
jgi:hypothetical protein